MLVRRQPLLSAGWNPKRLANAGRLALVLALLSVFLRGKAFTITNGFTPVEVTMLLVWLGIALADAANSLRGGLLVDASCASSRVRSGSGRSVLAAAANDDDGADEKNFQQRVDEREYGKINSYLPE